MGLDFITGVIAAAIASAFGYFANILVGLINNKESKNIKIETDEIVKIIQNQPDYDVFKLLYKNVRESTEYYIISKRQANKSFILAIISCVFGVVIYICGFLIVAISNKDIAIFTTIAGTVVELVSGLSFWMYNKSLKQLNEYHKRLSSTEKYLISIQMADKMETTKREGMYSWIIERVMLADPDNYQFRQNVNDTTNNAQ
ncbi:MAG: hypothetical protein HDQ99_02370 [Lachnospiraceae bacterium]|nr:hypothetical protein [Lachnospiraceae bacterium]